jgi:hypothetical protein
MRMFILLLAVSFGGVAACSKSGSGAAAAIAKANEFKDKMCACKDKACVDQVSAELAKWSAEHKSAAGDKVSDDDQKKLTASNDDLTKCMSRLASDLAAAGSGSDTAAAGSGSAAGSAGSGDTGAGAGSASEGMAHRAGMCPSTVLGSTTKAAIKGHSVVVTIVATDKDAVTAIQRRADELLAEKRDHLTGNTHDRKGTHGGAQGLCPVYVPEGAKAKARHEPKGVFVTITPKDKPDELAKEIDERIAKAAEWVKSNVKPGDDGNQGGVGGGKGDDGSNHSGKGDSKGRQRKHGGGGTGGGKGKGTGGGSGAGDGSGTGKSGW